MTLLTLGCVLQSRGGGGALKAQPQSLNATRPPGDTQEQPAGAAEGQAAHYTPTPLRAALVNTPKPRQSQNLIRGFPSLPVFF